MLNVQVKIDSTNLLATKVWGYPAAPSAHQADFATALAGLLGPGPNFTGPVAMPTIVIRANRPN